MQPTSAQDVLLRELAEQGDLDAHTDLLAGAVDADAALVSLVGSQEQLALGRTVRRGDPIARRFDRSLSLCATALERGGELVVHDLAQDAILRDHPAHADHGIVGYAGVPLHLPDGTAVGMVCALTRDVRGWDEADLRVLRNLAVVVDERLATALTTGRAEAAAEDLRTRLLLVGHEVGNALTVVLNGVVTARRPDVDERLGERLLGTVEDVARQAGDLLDAVLRADQRAAVRIEEVDLDDLLLGVARRHGSRDRVACTATTLTLRTDPVLLRHVVDNLVDNAVKYGGPHIFIDVTAVDGGVCITVADDGPGIDPEVLATLLAPYERNQEDGSGYGLGLFLVRELLRRLGGTMELGPGPGTQLRVTVPDVTEAEDEAEDEDEADTA